MRLTKNFTDREFACKGKSCCGHEIMYNMRLVNVAQGIRNILGVPVRINSGYRCRQHNAEVGGVMNSDHLRGNAIDVSAGVSYAKLRAAVQRAVIAANEYGIYTIQYPHKNFIHIGWRG